MQNDDVDVLKLYVDNDLPGEGSLKLRMSPEIAEEVRSLLDEQGLEHSEAAEFSSDVALALETVQVLGVAAGSIGGLNGLAAVITAVTRRHDGKEVTLSSDGTVRSSGSSFKDLNRFLNQQAKRQAAIEAEWKQGESDK